jgi:Restriction endonuclease
MDNATARERAISQQWLQRLVADWGGFERLIAQLNETGMVTVEHNVTLTGRSGAPRQIDVLVRHKQGLYEHIVLVECKYWKDRVGRLHVDALASAIRDLAASRGVIFSVEGFESGAITQAQHDGIDLFKIREPSDEEWGLPGRHIDFYTTILSKSFANIRFPGLYMIGLPVANFNLVFGESPATSSNTPIAIVEGRTEETLEALILTAVEQSARALWMPCVLFDGLDGERLFWKHATVKLQRPAICMTTYGVNFIPEIAFDIALKLTQFRFKFDRGAKYSLILAVEDCITGLTTAATRERDATNTELVELLKQEAAKSGVLQNGSIMTVALKGFFPFTEVSHLANGEFHDTIKELPQRDE